MREFFITTDSNSDLPKDYIDKMGTTIIPQYYSFDDVMYGDEYHMAPAEFYDRMKNGALPLSQANNPAVIEEKFRALLNQGGDIIHISFASALSVSYSNVCMVAEELKKQYPEAKITVIDSTIVSLGESILVIHANEMKVKGASYEEIVEKIEAMKSHINAQFSVDDLFHLQRGGRISKANAVVGTVLSLKPAMFINAAGILTSAGTVRGRRRAHQSMIDSMKATLGDVPDYSLPVGIVHANCPEDAKALAEKVKAETEFKTVIINDISPSIGTHTGPGALGLLYYGAKRPEDAKM